jgi:alkyldihydroxyacetonephosphate synthase
MTLVVDAESLLACASGSMTLADVECELASSRLTLDVEGAKASRETVAGWLASGAPGAREAWLDPADHLVAGIDLRLHDGRAVTIRPAPRRAVGPDLLALVMGAAERFVRVERAWLRIHPVGVRRPNLGALAVDPDPPVSAEEARLLDAIALRLGEP